MKFMDLVKRRVSVRRYKPDPVPEEKVTAVLEAARLAPSWKNSQCWRFIVVKDVKVRKRLVEATGQAWLSSAPVIIVGCADPEVSGRKGDQWYYMLDMGIAMEHLILDATEQGLGTCWVGLFDEEKAKRALGVPENIRIIAMTPLGYSDESLKPKGRKPLSEIVFADKYGRR